MNQEERVFAFRKITEADFPLLRAWFREPHIKHWWPISVKDEDFTAYFLPKINSQETVPFLALMNGMPLGYIQYYHIDRTPERVNDWLPELPLTTIGIDQFIGNKEYIGKGYGTELVRNFIAYFASTLEPGVTTIIVDPDPANYAAIRCYEKAGFKHVDEYETGHGYSALLMRYDI